MSAGKAYQLAVEIVNVILGDAVHELSEAEFERKVQEVLLVLDREGFGDNAAE